MRRITLLAALLFAAPLLAEPLRVDEPRAGAVLRGGGFATIAWSAASLPAGAEEWEAFLSVDGGRYYAFRITPHLDLDVRRFSFLVPNVDARDVRILIRTGDERRETLFEVPARFAIARDASAVPPAARAIAGHSRAEAAREGDAPVVAWAEGDRAGSRVEQQQAAPSTPASIVAAARDDVATSIAAAPKTIRRAALVQLERARTMARSRLPEPAPEPFAAPDLALLRRLNI